jgi:hypothetical protein
VANERQASCYWSEEEMLEQSGTLANAIVGRIGFGLFREQDGRRVLDEIHPAAFALSAMGLLMVTGRTLERERRVTSRTEASAVDSLRRALGAFHTSYCAARNSTPRRQTAKHLGVVTVRLDRDKGTCGCHQSSWGTGDDECQCN